MFQQMLCLIADSKIIKLKIFVIYINSVSLNNNTVQKNYMKCFLRSHTFMSCSSLFRERQLYRSVTKIDSSKFNNVGLSSNSSLGGKIFSSIETRRF